VSKKILVIDDEDNIRKYLKIGFESKGHIVETVKSGREFMGSLNGNLAFDLVILDLVLPDVSGLEILRHLKAHDPDVQVIIITAFGEIQSAVDAMKLGASDYITKPFELAEIELAAERIFEMAEMKKEISVLRYQVGKYLYEDMVGGSERMLEVFRTIEMISSSGGNCTVLILGESGTGKELAARAVHNKSDRRNKPFVALNCTAIQEGLLESELFGHEKGAFTGALSAKEGLFEIADGGTVFLDEIGDMDLKLQAKLLRFLEDRSFRTIGGVKEITVDVRIIASTNRNLEKEIARGRFREDLYYRLKVIPLTIPPLRDRKEDIPMLVNYFVNKFCVDMGKKPLSVDSRVMGALGAYRWPGNVRELKNLIERLVILTNGETIEMEHLPKDILAEVPCGEGEAHQWSEPFSAAKARVVRHFEKDYLSALLSKNGGNVSKSAREAEMDRGSFLRLMRKYGIKSEDFAI